MPNYEIELGSTPGTGRRVVWPALPAVTGENPPTCYNLLVL